MREGRFVKVSFSLFLSLSFFVRNKEVDISFLNILKIQQWTGQADMRKEINVKYVKLIGPCVRGD